MSFLTLTNNSGSLATSIVDSGSTGSSDVFNVTQLKYPTGEDGQILVSDGTGLLTLQTQPIGQSDDELAIFSKFGITLTDFGNSWNEVSNTGNWVNSVALSASGQYQTAVVYGDNIYISTDYGASWTLKATSQNWQSVSVSASGQYQTAVVYGGNIYVSSDYGANWTSKATSLNWSSVSVSVSGQYQTAVVYSGAIYTSSDYGNTWNNTKIWFSSGLTFGAMSASGQYLSVATSGINIYSSNIYIPQSKSFIIDHPLDYNKYLVHSCLEGPEAGVYYRGKGEIKNNKSVEINLPNYVCAFAKDFTIKVTDIYDGFSPKIYSVGELVNNQFTVYGVNGSFFWTVTGSRGNILIEPEKSNIIVKGDGPYKWYESNVNV